MPVLGWVDGVLANNVKGKGERRGHADPKPELAVAAFEGGKHVFIEKPMCYSLQEADAIIAGREKAGATGSGGCQRCAFCTGEPFASQ